MAAPLSMTPFLSRSHVVSHAWRAGTTRSVVAALAPQVRGFAGISHPFPAPALADAADMRLVSPHLADPAPVTRVPIPSPVELQEQMVRAAESALEPGDPFHGQPWGRTFYHADKQAWFAAPGEGFLSSWPLEHAAIVTRDGETVQPRPGGTSMCSAVPLYGLLQNPRYARIAATMMCAGREVRGNIRPLKEGLLGYLAHGAEPWPSAGDTRGGDRPERGSVAFFYPAERHLAIVTGDGWADENGRWVWPVVHLYPPHLKADTVGGASVSPTSFVQGGDMLERLIRDGISLHNRTFTPCEEEAAACKQARDVQAQTDAAESVRRAGARGRRKARAHVAKAAVRRSHNATQRRALHPSSPRGGKRPFR